MKKLLSEAAIRAKRIFLAIASFFSTLWAKVLSTFRKSKNAEAQQKLRGRSGQTCFRRRRQGAFIL